MLKMRRDESREAASSASNRKCENKLVVRWLDVVPVVYMYDELPTRPVALDLHVPVLVEI